MAVANMVVDLPFLRYTVDDVLIRIDDAAEVYIDFVIQDIGIGGHVDGGQLEGQRGKVVATRKGERVKERYFLGYGVLLVFYLHLDVVVETKTHGVALSLL